MTAQLPQNQNNNVILQSLLKTYQDFFQEPKGFPPSKAHGHVIPLKQWSQAVNLMAYRYLRLQKDVLKNIVMEMLEAGTIKPSTNPFTSLVILVKKKKNSTYRALNKLTIKDKYPITMVEGLLEELMGTVVFSKIDLESRYHQIWMALGEKIKIAFRKHGGHYEFLVMSFGLTNTLATFQSLINEVFREHFRKFILVFFDDILVYSQTLTNHYKHLRTVL